MNLFKQKRWIGKYWCLLAETNIFKTRKDLRAKPGIWMNWKTATIIYCSKLTA